MEILFASSNEGKFREAREFAEAFGLSLRSPRSCPGVPPIVEETEPTYLGNAQKKAFAFMKWSGLASLADDSGLEVSALGGAPGLYTARYAGEGCTMQDNWNKLLGELEDVTDRSARFVCHLYLAYPDGSHLEANESLFGSIALEPSGGGGFGYDPLFVVDKHQHTLAELKDRRIPVQTHRTKALQSLFAKLGSLP